ncbi:MAG: sigma 54-interacting transcriptional regulator [Nitrospirales bacterium]|nr:sigma 54-interacting transcriptional regulator [Nitrospirales bacterium]
MSRPRFRRESGLFQELVGKAKFISKMKVRIIAATNRKLTQEVETRRFRQDLR